MKTSHLIALALLLSIGSAKVIAATSSLTLQYGPSFSQTTSPITYFAQPTYDFGIDQFWNSNGMTNVTITLTEHVEQTDLTIPSDWICACITAYTPPPIYSLSFYIHQPVVAPYAGSQYVSEYFFEPIYFGAYLPGDAPTAGFLTLHVGEIETQLDSNGYEILTRFAADFKLQAGEQTFAEVVDPETGFTFFEPEFTEYPGDWFAGSLRYHSDTEAFSFLSPVPEPEAYMQMLAGLGVIGFLARRRRN